MAAGIMTKAKVSTPRKRQAMIVRFVVELGKRLQLMPVKISSTVALTGILILLPLCLQASPNEPEFYDPIDYINQGVNTYDMMNKAKELTRLLETRMEYLMRLKIQDARDAYVGLDGGRYKGKFDELLRLINSTQEAWVKYAQAVAAEKRHGGGTGASLRYSYAYISEIIKRIKELKPVLK